MAETSTISTKSADENANTTNDGFTDASEATTRSQPSKQPRTMSRDWSNCSVTFEIVDELNSVPITADVRAEWPCQLLKFWKSFKPFVNAVKFLLHYGTVLIVVVGVVCNILALIVLLNPLMRKVSANNYLAALAIYDTCSLLFNFLVGVLRGQNPDTINKAFQESETLCKVHSVGVEIFNILSVWMIVCMTIERAIAVLRPLKVQTLCTVSKARKIIVIVTIVIVVVACHKIFVTGFEGDSVFGYKACRTSRSSIPEIIYLYVAVNTWTPCVIIIILNSIILISLKKSANAQQAMTAASSNNAKKTIPGKSQTRITKVLLLVSTTYLILILPLGITQSVELFYNATYKKPVATDGQALIDYVAFMETRFTLKWIRAFCFFFYQINFAINFFLYCVSGKRFRDMVRVIFPFCGTPARSDSIRSSSTKVSRISSQDSGD
ncbi:putative G-protein coupled receptor 139 [Tubulanus polymorphus]|uniref:putative G-protein coupled receptor 139 n=1 Tax=Tubulanus polymorphus TaxID=672921 RepID=UPI003DA455C0